MAKNCFDVGHARRRKKIVEHAHIAIDKTATGSRRAVPADVELLEVRAGVAKVLVADFECVLPKVFQFAALKVYDGKMNISKQSYLALIKTK